LDAATEKDKNLLKELQQIFHHEWSSQNMPTTINSIKQIEQKILEIASLQSFPNYRWIYQKKEEVADFLMSQFSAGLVTNEPMTLLLDQLASIGYIHKVK
jgi:hypothetical protein